MSVRCLLADDHPALIAAVGGYLAESGFEIIGPAHDARRAVAIAALEQPELAVVDYRMPGLSGRDLLAQLKEVAPDTRVVVYTADAEQLLVRDALAGGARGIVLKEAPLEDLVRALESVAAGRAYIDPALASDALGEGSSGPLLTDRERSSLTLLAQGRQHDEIGGLLGIGVETVRTHLRKATEKLGATTRTQAVATAIRLGLID